MARGQGTKGLMRWNYLTLYLNDDGSPEAYEENDEGRKEVNGASGPPDVSLFQCINSIGFDGWELVTTVSCEHGNTLIFKKPFQA
jgi:hypothetical protein